MDKKNKEITKDSARFVEWHGHHDGKYYNRSNPKYKNIKAFLEKFEKGLK